MEDQEINDILKGRNIIGFIKKQRLNWLGHVERMAEDNNVQKIKRWKPMSKRPIGRPKTRWENNVLEDIRNMNVHNWKKMAQNRDSWKKAVEQARTLYRLVNKGETNVVASSWSHLYLLFKDARSFEYKAYIGCSAL